jgi:hypothetical protein
MRPRRPAITRTVACTARLRSVEQGSDKLQKTVETGARTSLTTEVALTPITAHYALALATASI